MKISRRDALQHLGAGALLSLGLWPGALRADNQVPAAAFRFIVVNDLHYMTEDCGHFLEGVVRRMKTDRAEFERYMARAIQGRPAIMLEPEFYLAKGELGHIGHPPR